MDFLKSLFDYSEFVPRMNCGKWTTELILASILSDGLIWLSYMTIPVFLAYLILKLKISILNNWIIWMFVAFIFSCGLTHFMDIVVFWYPLYKLAIIIKVITGIASAATVIALFWTIPKAAGAIQLTSDKLVAVIKAAFSGFIMIDEEGKILEWNPAAEKMFGWSKEETLNKEISDFIIPKNYIENHKNGLKKYLTTGDSKIIGKILQLTALHKDGHELAIELSISVIKYEGKNLFSAFIKDITKENKIKSRLEQYEKLFNASWDLICIADDTKFLQINESFPRILGYSKEELLSKPFLELIHPEDQEATKHEVEKLKQGEITINFSNRYKTINGNYKWLNWTAVPSITEKGIVFCIARDDTERRELEDTLKHANSELEQFAYIASHDLKSPLRAIVNLSQWLQEDLNPEELPENSRKHLTLINERVQRMNNLIEGLLQYSRIGRVYKTDDFNIKISEIIQEVLKLIETKNFTIKVNPRMPNLKGNKIMLTQLFLNLIGNAIKHHDKDNGFIEISFEEKEDSYQFNIKDDGPGIYKDMQHKLFTMFQSLSNDKENTGIGLALCKKIVEQAGGKIWIDSDKGKSKGATFSFTWLK